MAMIIFLPSTGRRLHHVIMASLKATRYVLKASPREVCTLMPCIYNFQHMGCPKAYSADGRHLPWGKGPEWVDCRQSRQLSDLAARLAY